MIFFSPMPMHIPDGFLSVIVSVVFWVLSVAAIALALRFVPRDLGERDVPVMGVLAGGLFLGEELSQTVFLALGLVGAGIWVANRPG